MAITPCNLASMTSGSPDNATRGGVGLGSRNVPTMANWTGLAVASTNYATVRTIAIWAFL